MVEVGEVGEVGDRVAESVWIVKSGDNDTCVTNELIKQTKHLYLLKIILFVRKVGSTVDFMIQ